MLTKETTSQENVVIYLNRQVGAIQVAVDPQCSNKHLININNLKWHYKMHFHMLSLQET